MKEFINWIKHILIVIVCILLLQLLFQNHEMYQLWRKMPEWEQFLRGAGIMLVIEFYCYWKKSKIK